MSQIKNGEPEVLPTSLATCDCYQNNSTTSTTIFEIITDQSNDISPIYRISYMWYSFMSAVLTVAFGMAISFLTDYIESWSEIGTTITTTTSINQKEVEAMENGIGNGRRLQQQQQQQQPADNIYIIGKLDNEKKTKSQQLHGVDNFAMKSDD